MEKDQERERAALILGSKHAAAAAAAVAAASFDSLKKQENTNKTKLTDFFFLEKKPNKLNEEVELNGGYLMPR